MGTSLPAVKTGVCDYLTSWQGLRPADGVVVSSAGTATLADHQVTLGDVVAPQARSGLARTAETPTMTCYTGVSKPGDGEAAIRAARQAAGALLTLVQAAIRADPTCGGAIPPPGGSMLGEIALEEYPTDIDGIAARRADYRFTITWESHIT
jgi:hypothetical protein